MSRNQRVLENMVAEHERTIRDMRHMLIRAGFTFPVYRTIPEDELLRIRSSDYSDVTVNGFGTVTGVTCTNIKCRWTQRPDTENWNAMLCEKCGEMLYNPDNVVLDGGYELRIEDVTYVRRHGKWTYKSGSDVLPQFAELAEHVLRNRIALEYVLRDTDFYKQELGNNRKAIDRYKTDLTQAGQDLANASREIERWKRKTDSADATNIRLHGEIQAWQDFYAVLKPIYEKWASFFKLFADSGAGQELPPLPTPNGTPTENGE